MKWTRGANLTSGAQSWELDSMGQEWDFACILESGPINMWKSLQLRERLEK